MKTSGIGEYSTQSMFSSESSPLTALILTPFAPTAAPIGSMFGKSVFSASFALCPGILDAAIMVTDASPISGTSFSINFSKNLGEVLVSSKNIPISGSMVT